MTKRLIPAVLVFAVVAMLLVGCQKVSVAQKTVPAVNVQTVQDVPNFSREMALKAIKQTINADYNKYQVTLVNGNLQYNGQSYYRFVLTDGKKAVEPSIIVSQENGAMFCYSADNSVTEIDPNRTFGSKC